MNVHTLEQEPGHIIEQHLLSWTPPAIEGDIPHGDMPGDKVEINDMHICKANTIFPELLDKLYPIVRANPHQRAVAAVCGGSGVGKSEIASILSWYLKQIGIGSYILSGDNYPYRIPMYNDAERLRIFRTCALRGMIADGEYTRERFETIHQLQLDGTDADPKHGKEYPWFSSYLSAGKSGLKGYLGTEKEIDFAEVTKIAEAFHQGAGQIWLKRMGRADTELWYEEVDFRQISILLIEWTHGNSDYYKGVDVPVLLNSTPQETYAHRKARNRDTGTDSPFTSLVLEIEQELLRSQAHKAQIILSKNGDLLSHEQYFSLMGENTEAAL